MLAISRGACRFSSIFGYDFFKAPVFLRLFGCMNHGVGARLHIHAQQFSAAANILCARHIRRNAVRHQQKSSAFSSVGRFRHRSRLFFGIPMPERAQPLGQCTSHAGNHGGAEVSEDDRIADDIGMVRNMTPRNRPC
jgi:hypothetical protein